MMAFSHAVAELTRYTVNFEALLTFYPVTTAPRLQGPRLIPLTGSVSSDDAVLVAGNPQSFLLGTGSESEAIWFGNAEPHAELTFKLNDSYTIELELNAAVGSASRNLHLVLNADVTTPFMVNVVVSDDDPAQDARSTAVTVQGMAFAGARCHGAALWSHSEGGVKAPPDGRRNGATPSAAYWSHSRGGA